VRRPVGLLRRRDHASLSATTIVAGRAAVERRGEDETDPERNAPHRRHFCHAQRSLTSDSFETTVTRTMPGTVRAPRVYEQIVGHIERAIYDGRLRQGQKLPPERQLARDLKASRVAVREALRTLELRGLVDVRQGSTGGYFVREVDDRPLVRDFETLFRLGRASWPQLVEARRLIEPEVASLAAQRATEADLKNLGAALDQRSEHAVAGLPARQFDLEFHRALAEAARNPVHAVITHALIELEAEVLVPQPELTEADSAQVETAHRRIFDAVAAGNAVEARAAMVAHIDDVQARLERSAVAF
jgi:GntR family transcriptional regulator, transcriptional repressor for pyruvate dehydrogenase complex